MLAELIVLSIRTGLLVQGVFGMWEDSVRVSCSDWRVGFVRVRWRETGPPGGHVKNV